MNEKCCGWGSRALSHYERTEENDEKHKYLLKTIRANGRRIIPKVKMNFTNGHMHYASTHCRLRMSCVVYRVLKTYIGSLHLFSVMLKMSTIRASKQLNKTKWNVKYLLPHKQTNVKYFWNILQCIAPNSKITNISNCKNKNIFHFYKRFSYLSR